MAFTNHQTKEINCKIVYFGCRGSGKTTTLRSIYNQTSAETKSGLSELDSDVGPTNFYDFLPVSLGQLKGYHLKLHLYSLPHSSLYRSVTPTILRGLDGVVFIADSSVESYYDNVESLEQMKTTLFSNNYILGEIPRVFQYNKRDLEGAVPVPILRQQLNPAGFIDTETVATNSIGTLEALQAMAKLVMDKISRGV